MALSRTGTSLPSRLVVLLLSLVLFTILKPVNGLPTPQDGGGEEEESHWVDIWASMPQLVEPNNMPPAPYASGNAVFRDATLRQTVYVTLPATQIRLTISNAFGTSPLPITEATVALPGDGAAGVKTIKADTLVKVTFGGQPGVTIPAGQLVMSDPIDITVEAESNLSVSLYSKEGQSGSSITGHPGSRTTSWYAAGNQVANADLTSPANSAHWYWLSAVEAWKPIEYRAFILVGDSITDGRGSTDNGNNRWPDILLKNFKSDPELSKIAVINQAAGGNRVLGDGLGPKALGRLERDVIKQGGVGWALLFIGVNDIGGGGAEIADQLISAYKTMSKQLHDAGIPVFGGTITPFGGPGQAYSTPVREAARQKVNAFIRNSGGVFDAVVDLDAAIKDPGNAANMAPQFDGGDHLHPNVAGFTAMAAAFPTDVFAKFPPKPVVPGPKRM